MYDIAIIGGGPAGATLARLIGQKYKVLLLERRTFQAPLYSGSQKCCGGLIAPGAQKMLALFGLGVPKSVISSPQMFAVRTIDIDNSLERYYQRHYINIDREEFDKWLEAMIPSGVEVINGSIYRGHEETTEYVNIKFSKAGKDYEAKTKLIVGADGAFSKVRLRAFPGQILPKKYVAIQEWFETTQNVNYYGAIFDKTITDFYSWTIPKDNYLILGSALYPNSNAHQKFNLLKAKLQRYGFEFNQSIRKNGTFLFRPEHTGQIFIGKGRVALIGEAAGFISPSSAEGLSYAFRSALALSKALSYRIESWHGVYKRNTLQLIENVWLKNLKSPFMYHHTLRRWVMKAGIKSMKLYINQ
ncbi:MAG TPA: FAD-binding protein [Firmicutes bacterium]|nr:FAD-binding protein [Bacillota bacterium]